MSYTKCQKCKSWHWEEERCPPLFRVYHEEYNGDEPIEIRATDFDDAAIEYAEHYNTKDYGLMGSTATIKIEKYGVFKFYEIGAEQSIDYSEKEIDEEVFNQKTKHTK